MSQPYGLISIPDEPMVSVVIPVKNGSGRLQHCLESLLRQDLPRSSFEIIVADGCSRDDTVQIARQYGCVVVDNPRETVAGGRNAGVAVARGRYIAFTEDDIVLPAGWMRAGLAALCENPALAAVGGPTPIPPFSSAFARAVDVIFRTAASQGYSVQSGNSLPTRVVTDLPGGNVMYRREDLLRCLPVNEQLVTGEDVELHCRMRDAGGQFAFVSEFSAWHHKRDLPSRFFRQIRRFAQGRVQVGRVHRSALRLGHVVAAIFPVPLLALLVVLSPGLAGAVLFTGVALSMLLALAAGAGLRSALWMPVVTVIFAVAWPIGFFQEWLNPTRDATGK